MLRVERGIASRLQTRMIGSPAAMARIASSLGMTDRACMAIRLAFLSTPSIRHPCPNPCPMGKKALPPASGASGNGNANENGNGPINLAVYLKWSERLLFSE